MSSSQSNVLEILDPQPREVRVGQLTVLVKEISWVDLLRFLELLAAKSSELVSVTTDGKVAFNLERLPSLIKSSDELVAFLLKVATDINGPTATIVVPREIVQSPPALESLSARVMLRLIDVVLEVNLNEEFFAAGKSVANRLKAALPVTAKAQSADSSKP